MNQVKVYESFEQFCKLQLEWIKKEHEEEKLFIQRLTQELSYTQLIELGYAVGKLRLIKVKLTFGNRIVLVFQTFEQWQQQQQQQQIKQQEDKQKETLRLKQGDQVGIYMWRKVQNSSKFQHPEAVGVIDRYSKHLRIILDQNSKIDEDSDIQYAIALQENYITYKRYTQVLDDLKQNYEKHPIIKALFSSDEEYKYNRKIKQIYELTGESAKGLNMQQRDAIQTVMNQPYIALIHGPPGTGKTRTICEYIKQAVLIQKQKILACANSNIAVDNMIERLQSVGDLKICRIGNPARMTEQVRYVCIDSLIKKTSSYAILKSIKIEIQQLEKKLNRSERKDYSIKDQLKIKRKELIEQEQLSYEEVIQDCQVIFCTNVGSGQYQFQHLTKSVTFDVVVIDECAQSLEISCWIPILKGKKAVLAGDHCQLPPTIKTKGTGLEMTLFERIEKEHQINTQLTIQYRMNTSIMQWSSNEFYDGHLIADESVANRKIQDTILLFIDTMGCQFYEQQQENFDDQNKSKFNQGEAGLVQIVVEELQNLGVNSENIGVITPYNGQVQLLKQKIENVEISTVDGFQGREKDCIIISMVRSNKKGEVGFLSESRRMNVAVTRAKMFVCLIGDSETVSKDPFLNRLITYFSENGEIRNAQQYADNDYVQVPIDVLKGNDENNQEKKKKKKKNKQQEKDPQQQDFQKEEIQQQLDEQQQLDQQILQFIQSNNVEIVFKDQNSYQRRLLHELAEKYNLNHKSIGNDKIKTLILSKQGEIQEKQIIDQQEENNQQEQKIEIQQVKVEQKRQQPKQQEKKPQQPPQKKQSKNQNNNKQKKTKEELEKEEDDFFASIPLLDEKKCAYMKNNTQCNKPLNLLSILCNFCQKKFCQSHLLAEEHGCGEAASQAARQYVHLCRKQFLSNTYEHERNQRIIQEKIKSQQEQRKSKPKK